MFLNLLKDVKIAKVHNGAGAAQTLLTSSTIAMDGFNSVLVIADFAAFVDTGVATLQLQDGAAANGSDAANIAGASVAVTGATSGNGQLVLDAQKPQKRYITVTLNRQTANITVNSITCILYNTNAEPTTQPTTVLNSNEVNCAA